MKHEAIYALYSDVVNVSVGDEIKAFDKDGNKVTIDEDAVTTKANELAAANQYKWKRISSYPAIEEQLDMLYHDMTAGKGDKTGDWYTAIAKVKSDNPKPQE